MKASRQRAASPSPVHSIWSGISNSSVPQYTRQVQSWEPHLLCKNLQGRLSFRGVWMGDVLEADRLRAFISSQGFHNIPAI